MACDELRRYRHSVPRAIALAMVHQHYRLIVSLRAAGSDTGKTLQTWTITAETTSQAVKLAKLYADCIPGKALRSAMLAEVMGKVIWQKRHDSREPGSQQRHRVLP